MAFAPYPGSIKEHTDILGAVWHRLPFPAGWREVVQEHFVGGWGGEAACLGILLCTCVYRGFISDKPRGSSRIDSAIKSLDHDFQENVLLWQDALWVSTGD